MELTILKTAFFYYNFTSQNKGSDVSIRILLTLLAALFLFAGCATRQAPEVVIYEEPAPAPVLIPQVEDVPQQSDGWVSRALKEEYEKWADTPYMYGGETLAGTDCSSLVRQVYQDAFDIKLPRSSVDQAKLGHEVKRGSCKEGDLVFFKINAKTHHSGIIVEKGKFLHASTKEGVKISRLNNPYWTNKVVKIKRIIPEEGSVLLKPTK